MHDLAIYVKEGLAFAQKKPFSKTLHIHTYVFDWLCFTQSLSSFPSIDNLICLYAQILMVFCYDFLICYLCYNNFK